MVRSKIVTGRSRETRCGGCFLEGYIITPILYVIILSPFFGHAKTECRSGRKHLRGRAHPGLRVYSHQWGERFTGGGQLQNCHAQCNAPPVWGRPHWVETAKDVPLCHLRAYPYCICRQKVARNMERMTKLAVAHAEPHFCGRYELNSISSVTSNV